MEIRKLRTLANLTFLTVAGNPLCDMPHYRLYIIYHLRGLDVLDGKRITQEERLEAERRFDQQEVDALHNEVYDIREKYEQLQEEHNKSLHELQSSHSKDNQLQQTSSQSYLHMPSISVLLVSLVSQIVFILLFRLLCTIRII